jgi:hypothetical protein
MLVVVAAVVMWESPQRFPRAVVRVEKQFHRFSMLSTDRHFHGLFGLPPILWRIPFRIRELRQEYT